MKFLFLLLFLSFAGNLLAEEVSSDSAGPAGPLAPAGEAEGTPLPSDKPTIDLPYKPSVAPSPLLPSETTEASTEFKIPFLPSLSPDPVGAPDPMW